MQSSKPLPRSPRQFNTSADGGAEFIAKLSAEPQNWHSIPLLNYTPLHMVKDQSVVRFRGMIQDMADPEIYYERYEVRSDDGRRYIRQGKYRDLLCIENGEHLETNAPATKRSNRRTFSVVSVPSLNNWVQDYEGECNKRNFDMPGGSSKKRPAEEGEPNKRLRVSADMPTSSSAIVAAHPALVSLLSDEYLLNSPIPDRPSKACMVIVYDNFDTYTLNSIVDVVGFLSIDPSLDASTAGLENSDGMQDANELRTTPPLVIPRLHGIVVHVLPHANPLLDARLLSTSPIEFDHASMRNVHKELRMLLTMVLCNDDLAADYLLSHLISTVYSRANLMSIGKFTLNLLNVSDEILQNYTNELYKILELLLVSSHYLPMSLEKLNTDTFLPKKDYVTNKLLSGQLQLAAHTHLVLDETKMQQGTLDASGVAAIKSLIDLINKQQIQCNFEYYNLDYDVDVPVLILSEGRSMLPIGFAVPLKTDGQEKTFISETLKAAHHYLDAERLDKFRRFITLAKLSKFSLTEEQSDVIQNDFVEMRKANVVGGPDDLHALLVLTRLLGIARGGEIFDIEWWELAKKMEAERKQRIAELPKSNVGTRAP